MKTKINFQNKQGFAVHSGCRAGESISLLTAKDMCEKGCIADRDFRSVYCFVKGWPKEDQICTTSQRTLDACLSDCS